MYRYRYDDVYNRQLVGFSSVPQSPYALRAMERFVRAVGSAVASGGGGEVASGGGGGQSSSSRAAEPGVDSGPRGIAHFT